jgi:release factor glutamine methyltransferase
VLLETARSPDALATMVEQRATGRPLEHVVGWAELCGVRVAVDDGVFVPRRRSELLVRTAVDVARECPARPVVLDLCCGCGAVGVAVARLTGDVELHAAELDPASTACARRNVEPDGGRVHEGDLYDALPVALRGRVDVLVVNAPYVPTADIAFLPAEARDFEPRVALDGGADGVEVQRRVAAGAGEWLAPGGRLLVETSGRQAALTVAALERAGLATRVVADDDLGATVVIGAPRR